MKRIYDMTLEFLEENQVGWYLFELMIGEDGWNKVHGLVYPDGTIRDSAIIAALFGFYRRRKGEIIRVDVNQEGYVIYPFIQNNFVKGITLGGTKG